MDTTRIYTAWELAADHEWTDEGRYVVRAERGRVDWDTVEVTRAGDGERVRLQRLDPTPGLGIRIVTQYVPRDSKMRLVEVAGWKPNPNL